MEAPRGGPWGRLLGEAPGRGPCVEAPGEAPAWRPLRGGPKRRRNAGIKLGRRDWRQGYMAEEKPLDIAATLSPRVLREAIGGGSRARLLEEAHGGRPLGEAHGGCPWGRPLGEAPGGGPRGPDPGNVLARQCVVCIQYTQISSV